jgi:hypothetical protein
MIIDIALLVARVCDRLAIEFVEEYISRTMERIVQESMTIRARLLHYFPPLAPSPAAATSKQEDDSWCALHADDGCPTGLSSALFVDESTSLPHPSSNFKPVPAFCESPDPLADLHLRSRTLEVARANIPPDCLAFQTGSALEKKN